MFDTDVVSRGEPDPILRTERCSIWNDQAIGIQWLFEGIPILSGKDRQGAVFVEAEHFQ